MDSDRGALAHNKKQHRSYDAGEGPAGRIPTDATGDTVSLEFIYEDRS